MDAMRNMKLAKGVFLVGNHVVGPAYVRQDGLGLFNFSRWMPLKPSRRQSAVPLGRAVDNQDPDKG